MRALRSCLVAGPDEVADKPQLFVTVGKLQ